MLLTISYLHCLPESPKTLKGRVSSKIDSSEFISFIYLIQIGFKKQANKQSAGQRKTTGHLAKNKIICCPLFCFKKL